MGGAELRQILQPIKLEPGERGRLYFVKDSEGMRIGAAVLVKNKWHVNADLMPEFKAGKRGISVQLGVSW